MTFCDFIIFRVNKFITELDALKNRQYMFYLELKFQL